MTKPYDIDIEIQTINLPIGAIGAEALIRNCYNEDNDFELLKITHTGGSMMGNVHKHSCAILVRELEEE